MKKIYIIIFLFVFILSIKTINAYEIKDGIYTIQSGYDHSKVIDLAGGNVFDTSNVQIYDNNGTNAQQWYIKSVGNGYYTISIINNDNMVLDVAGGRKNNGANVHLYSYNGTAAQLWSIEDVGTGYVMVPIFKYIKKMVQLRKNLS